MTSRRDIQTLAMRLRPVFEKHHVLRAILFGSLARGEASRRSDVDLIVVEETHERFLDRYDGLLKDIVQAVPERGVDLLIYTPGELDRMSDSPFISRALRDGTVIYELESTTARG